MSINLEGTARAHGQWASVEEAIEVKRSVDDREGQSPILQNASGRVVEQQIKQLKEMSASSARVASMLDGGTLATLEKLMIMLREMQADSRDMWREFASDQQQTAYTMRVTAYETRMTSIEKTYNASMIQGFGQILSGIVGVAGAVTGNQVISTGAASLGKLSEGVATMVGAAQTREAQINQSIFEFQQGNADEFRKTLDSAVDKANEASRQMREWTKELIELQNRVMSAVRF